MKKLIVCLSVILVAAIVYVASYNQPPQPVIVAKEQDIKAVRGSYCWEGFISAQCVDTISPVQLVSHHKLQPVTVSPGAKIQITFQRKPIENTIHASRWLSEEEQEAVPLTNNVMIAPNENGMYTYSFSAAWEKGSASYVFVVRVE